MKSQSIHFKSRSSTALDNQILQENLRKFGSGGLAFLREKAVHEYGVEAFETLRDAAQSIRARVLEHQDLYLARFEQEATARGATVLYAESIEEARALALEICHRHGVKKAVKSKSMVSEEAGINEVLIAAGIETIETDLGEYIIQLANEPPSHIIAPAVHKSKDEVSDLFHLHHRKPRKTDIAEMTMEARNELRHHFLDADLGISGGNFLIAETGSGIIVTNEGNGRMVTTLPRVHLCITGIEKVIPTLEDLSTLLRALTRSATGQPISNYASLFTGPRRQDDLEGPEHLYYVLVDNGRSQLVGSELADMLRCIRCGACMNHCPVYKTIGGHAYGWVYPGPMGSVLTPALTGVANALDLPQASTLCGACSVVCPVKIPLPELLRSLRERQVTQGLRPWRERTGLLIWGWVARRPRAYALFSKFGALFLKLLANDTGMIRWLPFGSGWTKTKNGGRYMPSPTGKTFRELFSESARK